MDLWSPAGCQRHAPERVYTRQPEERMVNRESPSLSSPHLSSSCLYKTGSVSDNISSSRGAFIWVPLRSRTYKKPVMISRTPNITAAFGKAGDLTSLCFRRIIFPPFLPQGCAACRILRNYIEHTLLLFLITLYIGCLFFSIAICQTVTSVLSFESISVSTVFL